MHQVFFIEWQLNTWEAVAGQVAPVQEMTAVIFNGVATLSQSTGESHTKPSVTPYLSVSRELGFGYCLVGCTY